MPWHRAEHDEQGAEQIDSQHSANGGQQKRAGAGLAGWRGGDFPEQQRGKQDEIDQPVAGLQKLLTGHAGLAQDGAQGDQGQHGKQGIEDSKHLQPIAGGVGQGLLQNIVNLIGEFLQAVACAADPAAQIDMASGMLDRQRPAAGLASGRSGGR